MTAAPLILTTSKAVLAAIDRVAEASRVRPLRSARQFAEQEIILPSGPFQGERLKIHRQPWLGLWLDQVDSGRWRRFMLTGPSQAGKTLGGSAIPVMHHLFEHRETVVYGAPTLEMAADKWQQDVLPLIRASRYRDLLPDRGAGSKGGAVSSIQFKHGPTLKFMTGGGNDKVRAGFTSRVVVITEVDGLDEAGGSSRETDKISQIEARSNAFGERARTYLECTVSTDIGRTWKELKEGTDSHIVLPCPHCLKWVTPEREHLGGWQEAANINEASQRASLACPSCGVAWSEPERTEANRRGRVVHKSQSVEVDGTVVGILPATNTLGFRFTSVNNLFTTIPRVAEQEWSAPRQGDSTLAEKGLRQFWWALPSESETITLTELDAMAITRRVANVPRGRVPGGVQSITVGIDLGKWLCHWVAVAWTFDGTPHVVEYGRLECPSSVMAEELAITTALRKFRDEACVPGWPSIDSANMRPSLVLMDAGNQWEGVVVNFCRESGNGFLPAKGFGTSVVGQRKKMHDPGYEAVAQPSGHNLVEINADVWKSFVHARIQTPVGQPGGLALFHASPTEHLSFAKHLTAEKRVEEFVAGRGLVTKWEALSRNNHYLDALALACVGGHGIGVRVGMPQVTQARSATPENNLSVSDWHARGRGKW